MNKQQLASRIWAAAYKMRSKIDANEYKDYFLGFIFYKFLSDGVEKKLRADGWAMVSAVGKSRATVMRAVALLKQQGVIEHRGSDKTGGYFPAASAHKEKK